MQSRTRTLYIIAALIVFLGLGLAVAGMYRAALDTSGESDHVIVPAGDKAANFDLETLDGSKISLSELKGKVVFLNVWATWCGPCREEMPSMESLYEKLKNRKDFVMLAVSQDERGKDAVLPYVQKHGYHFTVLLDPENKVGQSYDVSGVPETFIINREGRIVAHHMGAFDWSRPDVKEALDDLLNAKKASAPAA